MIRNVAILTANDLAIGFKNKTLYLILFIPLFIAVVLQLVDGSENAFETVNIGLLERGSYPPAMLQGLESAGEVFNVVWLPGEAEGKRWLSEGHGEGLLVPASADVACCTLVVVEKTSLHTVAVVESLSVLQRSMEGGSNWIAEIRSLRSGGIKAQMVPTWILVLVLMVAFVVLPAQVAEEKEKKHLLGLLQTPMRELDWLLAKVCFGVLSIVGAALLLHVLTGFQPGPGSALSYLVFLLAGGFCFSAFGVFVGFLCRTQATARTLGILLYLPHLLPSALADFSQTLNTVAPLLPSYQFYRPVKAMLLEGGVVTDFPVQLAFLILAGLVLLYLSYRLMKQRWLM